MISNSMNPGKTKYTDNRRIYEKILKLSFPIVLQNILSAAVNSADVVMLNYVGQSAISAVSLATQYAAILFMVYNGLGTGAAMLCAQYYGKKDLNAIKVVEGIAMRFSVSVSALFALGALLIPETMMRVFTTDTELIGLGAAYLRILSVGYLCWGFTEVYLAVLRSMERVVISMAMNVLAFSLNILFNAIFIFGLFGAPRLGVAGVAIATSLSRLIELIACVIVSIKSKDIKMNPAYMFLKNKLLLQDFLKMSLPALINDVSWGVAFSTYSIIFGHLGSDAIAANSFVVVVRNFGTVLCYGIAQAGTILLGNIIGEKKMEAAEQCARLMVKMTMWAGVAGGFIVLGVTPFVLQFADVTETARHYLKYMLLMNSYYVVGAALNTTMIAGIFRAGGDTRFGMICDTIDMWCYAVPLGFLAAFVLDLPVLWVYFLLCTDEFVKWPWVIKRYQSKKWLNNITRENIA